MSTAFGGYLSNSRHFVMVSVDVEQRVSYERELLEVISMTIAGQLWGCYTRRLPTGPSGWDYLETI